MSRGQHQASIAISVVSGGHTYRKKRWLSTIKHQRKKEKVDTAREIVAEADSELANNTQQLIEAECWFWLQREGIAV